MIKSAKPSPPRQLAAAAAGAVIAALGALIVGEYDFSGATPYVAGVLFGLVIGEVLLTVAGSGTLALSVVAAIEGGLGLWWAAWISSGRGIAPLPSSAFVAIALGVVVSSAWVSMPSRRRSTPANAPPVPGEAVPSEPGPGEPGPGPRSDAG